MKWAYKPIIKIIEEEIVDEYFFYSEKQRGANKLDWQNPNNICAQVKLSDGSIVDYTECRGKPEPSGNWDDYEHLGTGRVYSVNGVVQRSAN